LDKKTDKERKRKNYSKPELTKHKPLREVTMGEYNAVICSTVVQQTPETCP